jgi:hypothetical protein
MLAESETECCFVSRETEKGTIISQTTPKKHSFNRKTEQKRSNNVGKHPLDGVPSPLCQTAEPPVR